MELSSRRGPILLPRHSDNRAGNGP
jgi:hypothetical protein